MVQVSPFFRQDKTCPVCGKTFSVMRIRSSSVRTAQRMPDFQIIYEGINLTHYQIFVCPNCYYAAPDTSFDTLTGDRSKIYSTLVTLRENEPDFAAERSPEVALRSYELAIRSGEARSAPSSFQAAMYLRAAWIAREMGRKEKEKPYIDKARQLYKEAFTNERLTGKLSGATLMYLIGELNRQCGYFNEAVRWFSRSVSSPDIKKEPEIERLARLQWELARQQARNEGPAENEGLTEEETPTIQTAVKTSNPLTIVPATDTQNSAARRQRGSNAQRMRLTASLYGDQIEWLKELSNRAYKQSKTLLEREAVIRSLIDAAMESFPDIERFSTESELTEAFIKAMHQGKK